MKKPEKKTPKPAKKPVKKSPKPAPKKAPVKNKVAEKKVKPAPVKKPIPAAKAASIKTAPTKTAQKPVMTPKASSAPVVSPRIEPKPKVKPPKLKIPDDDLPLDLEEKEDLAEEEKRDLAKALRDDDDDVLDTSFIPTDTSERYILVVDEEGPRRGETVTIISQILPNAIVEVADDPDEAWDIMQDVEFDTYVVNFLMPGYSASAFVKAVANHPDHPLLLGFAADKISDAVDPKKGLKIIPLKRLFDLEANTGSESAEGDGVEA